jgi:hypothetical protein
MTDRRIGAARSSRSTRSEPNSPQRRRRRRLLVALASSALLCVSLVGLALTIGRPDAAVAQAATATVTLATTPGTQLLTPIGSSGDVTFTVSATGLPTGASIASADFQYSPAGQNLWQSAAKTSNGQTFATIDTSGVADLSQMIPDGLYDLRAVVTDTGGNTYTSAVLSNRLIANQSPVVNLKLASPASAVRGTIELSASDESGDPYASELGALSFWYSPAGQNKWTEIASGVTADASGNFTAQLDTAAKLGDGAPVVPDGSYDFRVIGTDTTPEDGLVFDQLPLTGVSVDNTPPTVSLDPLASPLQGQVQVTASASDSGSGVASVRFQYAHAGSDDWADFGGASYAAPYTSLLNTLGALGLANGDYQLRAVATDVAGNPQTSAPVEVTVSNPALTPAVSASVVDTYAPATSVGILGTVMSDAGGSTTPQPVEAWAYGLSAAPPAEVGGARLPYTAEGDQLVLLRYSYGTGAAWQVADVLRNADGSPFTLLPAADDPRASVSGWMASTGEAWLALDETSQKEGVSPVFGLFHRAAGGGPFVLDAALDPAGASYDKQLAALVGAGAQLRLNEDANHQMYGVMTAPTKTATTLDGTSVTEGLSFAILSGGAWNVLHADPPPSYAPVAGDIIELDHADMSSPDSGWATFGVTRASAPGTPLLLGHFELDPGSSAPNEGLSWTFNPTGVAPLDLGGSLAKTVTVLPEAVRVFGNELWVKASLSGGVNDPVVAELDATTGEATGPNSSWCSLPAGAPSCDSPLDGDDPANVPEAVFGNVALASGSVFASGYWSTLATPGFGGTADTFSSLNEGWLGGANAVGHWTTAPSNSSGAASSPLAQWPLPDRAPLTAVAAPPSSDTSSSAAQALAVGLAGTTLYYNATDGWLPAALPTTWEFAPAPAQTAHLNLLGVAFDGPTNAIAVGQYGAIVRWDGSNWTEDPQSFALTQEQLNAVAFAPNGDGWAVGTNGTILSYDGQSWSVEDPPPAEVGADITSVTVAGSTVYAVADGNLIERDIASGASWSELPASALPSDPAPATGALRLVAGLPDGGVVAGGVNELLVRDAGDEPFEYSAQPLQGVAVALSPFRQQGNGEIGAFVSIAPPVISADGANDVGGFPAGDGDLVRLTASGWEDLSQSQAPVTSTGDPMDDGSVKADPVLAVASDPSGTHAWAVGGYAGTLAASGLGNDDILAERSSGWYTASIWRYDSGGSATPAQLSTATLSVPAQPNTVSFAYFSSPECRWECSAVIDAQPDVNLSSAATQIAAYASQPGGPSFAVLGGNDRGPVDLQPGYDARSEYSRLPGLLAPLGNLPLYGVLGNLDHVNTVDDPSVTNPLTPWADAFVDEPEPFGTGPAPSAVTPLSGGTAAGEDAGAVQTYYAFNASQNGGTLRVIVLDNSQGCLDPPASGQTGCQDGAQTSWLAGQLSSATSANLPVVVFAAEPLRATAGGAADGTAVATMLANAGVLAVFTTNPSQLNQHYMVPANAAAGAAQIPEYEGASLGYQQTANNGVAWYFVSVDTAARTVSLDAVPLVSSIALEPLRGLTVARSVTLQFSAIARRPLATIATYANSSTATGDNGFPGFDQYLQIPAASCGSSPCVLPSYTFASSDPTIGTFVKASGPGSPYPALSSAGTPIPDPTSGLFCAYNTGTTTVSITAGLLTYSLPVTVQPGEFGPPCGTVYRAGVNKVEIVIGPSASGQDSNPTTTPPPPPPTASPTVATTTPPITLTVPHAPPLTHHVAKPPAPPVPVHQPAPTPSSAPAPAITPAVSVPVIVVPTPPTPVQPTPPGGSPVPVGGVAQSPATARREEKVHKHASQSAFTIRPAGTPGSEWFIGAVGGATMLTLLLLAAAFRPGSGLRPAVARRRPASSRNR